MKKSNKISKVGKGKSFPPIALPEGFWDGDAPEIIKMFDEGSKNGVYKTKKGKHTTVFNLKEPKVKKSKLKKIPKSIVKDIKSTKPAKIERADILSVDMHLGKRLAMIRENLGVSVIEVARLMNRAPQQVYNIEKTNINPKLSTIKNYLKALGHTAYIVIEPIR